LFHDHLLGELSESYREGQTIEDEIFKALCRTTIGEGLKEMLRNL